MKIKFIGAAEGVTGSKHMIMTNSGKQFLLDCGLYQGMGKETDEMNRNLGVNPTEIEAVLLSHAHIDHSGNLPLLLKQGFKGKIYCTTATFNVCKILLMDSAHIHEGDVSFINKHRRKKGLPDIKPLYTIHDTEKCLKQFKPLNFNTEFYLNDELSFNFSENGHIIGSSAINITSHETEKKIKLSFSGDIGRYTDPILKSPSVFPKADYIICESTYGNRIHNTIENSESEILKIVKNTCLDKKGKLIIPAFSLGRTQEILFILNKLYNKKLLPEIRIFVDSPLSAKATEVVNKHHECFNEELKLYLKNDEDPFGFPNLKYIQDTAESIALNKIDDPCIIISASGMCDAGRVKHHLRNTISNSKNTVLITGYCAPNTLGAQLTNGEKCVHIFGDFFDVKATIETIHSLSAHADYLEMIRYLSCQDKEKVKKIFLVHGETEAKISFREKLISEGYQNVIIPLKGESSVLG